MTLAHLSASRLVVLDTDGSHFKVLFHSQPWGTSGIEGAQSQDHILHWLPDDPEHVLIQLAEADSVFPGVFTLNVESGVTALRGRRAPAGARLDRRPRWRRALRLRLSRRTGAPPGAQQRQGPVAHPGEVQALRGRELLGRLPSGRCPTSCSCSPRTRVARRSGRWTLTENSDYQLVFCAPRRRRGRAWSPGQTTSTSSGFATTMTDRTSSSSILKPPPSTARWTRLFRAPSIDVLDASRDGRVLIIGSSSDAEPGIYHLFDRNKHQLLAIGRVKRRPLARGARADQVDRRARSRAVAASTATSRCRSELLRTNPSPRWCYRTAVRIRVTTGATTRWCS